MYGRYLVRSLRCLKKLFGHEEKTDKIPGGDVKHVYGGNL